MIQICDDIYDIIYIHVYRWVNARKTLLTHWSYVFLALTLRYDIYISKNEYLPLAIRNYVHFLAFMMKAAFLIGYSAATDANFIICPWYTPANTQRNKHEIVMSKRRFNVIITCLLRLWVTHQGRIHLTRYFWWAHTEQLGDWHMYCKGPLLLAWINFNPTMDK